MATLTNAELKKKLADDIARKQARLRDLEAKENAVARKRETRAKILIGAAVLADLSLHPEIGETVEAVLARVIKKPADKEVLQAFGLMKP